MALCNDFERLRGSILHYSPLSSIDSIVSELLVEEICLISHFEKGFFFLIPNPSVLVVPSNLSPNSQNKTYARVVFDKCSFCKQ